MKKRPYPEYISQKQTKKWITLKEEIHKEIIFLKRSGKKNTKGMKPWRNPQRNHIPKKSVKHILRKSIKNKIKNNPQGRNPQRNHIPEDIRKKEQKRNETLKKSTKKP
jgi:hypothetical protein